MKKNPKKPSSKLIVKNFSTLDLLVRDIFIATSDSKTGKVKSIKLLASHKNSLKELPISTKIDADELDDYIDLINKSDKELKVLLSLIVESANCRHQDVIKVLLQIFSAYITSIKFLNPLDESNILLSIINSIGSHNTKGRLSYLLTQVNNKFEKRIVNLKKQKKGASSSNSSACVESRSLTIKQLENLKLNTLSIIHLWCFYNGKATFDEVLNSINKQITNFTSDTSLSFDTDGLAKSKLIHFLTEQASVSNSDGFSDALKYFKSKQNEAESLKIKSERNADAFQKDIQSKKLEIDNLKIKNSNQESEILRLTEQVTALKSNALEGEQLVRAQKVHLKDDTLNVKAKASNFLSEEVLTELQTSLSLLDREKPKTHIAIHKLDLIIEKIEEEISWFKE